MNTDEIEQELRLALGHLYDPDYKPSEVLCNLLGCDPQVGLLTVQATLNRIIESLVPSSETPLVARTKRIFDVLNTRFVLKLTQEETAERLHMSVSSTRRAQREAIHALARLLRERYSAHQASQSSLYENMALQPEQTTDADNPLRDWRSQVKRDLEVLQKKAPNEVANVGDTIRSTVKLESILATKHGISLKTEPVPPDLIASIHPSVFRQILVMIIGQLVKNISYGEITIKAEKRNEHIRVTLTSLSPEADQLSSDDLVQEILSLQGASLEVTRDKNRITYGFELRSSSNITVFVLEDNPEVVYFYQRCVEGTRYRIVTVEQPEHLFDDVEKHSPDIIVLDIMLPDVDGWQLLSELHIHPKMRFIPVIVSSVIPEESLAKALGAALYLPKPASHQDFLNALDQVVGWTPDQGGK